MMGTAAISPIDPTGSRRSPWRPSRSSRRRQRRDRCAEEQQDRRRRADVGEHERVDRVAHAVAPHPQRPPEEPRNRSTNHADHRSIPILTRSHGSGRPSSVIRDARSGRAASAPAARACPTASADVSGRLTARLAYAPSSSRATAWPERLGTPASLRGCRGNPAGARAATIVDFNDGSDGPFRLRSMPLRPPGCGYGASGGCGWP